ncbi:hypothetical protein F5879DRAFT_920336 [Lentinula edodes]|nr:hypothetical protein F5879DRAFT_920336 [Lentinula edodes]
MSDLEDAPILAQLPSPVLATSGGSQWKHYQYKAIEQYQRFIGHDHKSRSYAEIHSLPRAHALWSRERSEELAESSPLTLYDHGLDNLISLKEEIDNIQGIYNFLRLKDMAELTVSDNTHAQESSYYSSPSPAREKLTIQVTGHDSSLQEVESDFLSSFEGLLEEPSREIQDTDYDSSFPEVEFLSSFTAYSKNLVPDVLADHLASGLSLAPFANDLLWWKSICRTWMFARARVLAGECCPAVFQYCWEHFPSWTVLSVECGWSSSQHGWTLQQHQHLLVLPQKQKNRNHTTLSKGASDSPLAKWSAKTSEKDFVPSIEGMFDSEGLSKEISINQVTDQDPSLSEVDFLSSFEGLFDEPEDIISIPI